MTCRGRIVDQRIVETAGKPVEVELTPVAGVAGVMKVTLYEHVGDAWRPAAERLVFRQPAKFLKLSATFDKDKAGAFKPGGAVKLGIESRNEHGEAAPAWLHAMVIDEKTLHAPDAHEVSLPTFFYVNSDLSRPEDLEDANIELSDAPGAAKALDLFLGTQGWRRFAAKTESLRSELTARKDQGKVTGPAMLLAQTDDAAKRFKSAVVAKQSELAQETTQQQAGLMSDRERAETAARAAAADLAWYQDSPMTWLRFGVGAAVALLMILGAALLVIGLVVALRARSSPRTLLGGSCLALFIAIVVFMAGRNLGISDADESAKAQLAWLRPSDRLIPDHVFVEDLPRMKTGEIVAEKGDSARLVGKVYVAATTRDDEARTQNSNAQNQINVFQNNVLRTDLARAKAQGFGGKGGAGKGKGKGDAKKAATDQKAADIAQQQAMKQEAAQLQGGFLLTAPRVRQPTWQGRARAGGRPTLAACPYRAWRYSERRIRSTRAGNLSRNYLRPHR